MTVVRQQPDTNIKTTTRYNKVDGSAHNWASVGLSHHSQIKFGINYHTDYVYSGVTKILANL